MPQLRCFRLTGSILIKTSILVSPLAAHIQVKLQRVLLVPSVLSANKNAAVYQV